MYIQYTQYAITSDISQGAKMNLIEVNGLCKNFDSFKLKDVSFSLEQGFIMGFIGRNGAG